MANPDEKKTPYKWATYESQYRLLCAVLASLPSSKLNYADIHKHFAKEPSFSHTVTESMIEHALRTSRKAATLLQKFTQLGVNLSEEGIMDEIFDDKKIAALMGQSTKEGVEFQLRSHRQGAEAMREARDAGADMAAVDVGPGATPRGRKRKAASATTNTAEGGSSTTTTPRQRPAAPKSTPAGKHAASGPAAQRKPASATRKPTTTASASASPFAGVQTPKGGKARARMQPAAAQPQQQASDDGHSSDEVELVDTPSRGPWKRVKREPPAADDTETAHGSSAASTTTPTPSSSSASFSAIPPPAFTVSGGAYGTAPAGTYALGYTYADPDAAYAASSSSSGDYAAVQQPGMHGYQQQQQQTVWGTSYGGNGSGGSATNAYAASPAWDRVSGPFDDPAVSGLQDAAWEDDEDDERRLAGEI